MCLLAGKSGQAIPWLRRFTGDCHQLWLPVEHMRAKLDFGQALEQTGDTKGACESYARVFAQWEQATPKSVSARAAKAAMKRLSCGS